MKLKMYVFGEHETVTTWVVAEDKEQAINLFEYTTGLDIKLEFGNLNDYVRELQPDEPMTYYHDCNNGERETIDNLINKYCEGPDIFATSDF